MNWAETEAVLRKRRKKYVRRYGKRTLRALDRYFARQSLVPTTPVLDSHSFPGRQSSNAMAGGAGRA